jgi:hypothetical protein
MYLSEVYGFERPDLYDAEVAPVIRAWNSVIERIRKENKGETTPTGKPIKVTDDNKKKIEEMSQQGWDAYELAKQ